MEKLTQTILVIEDEEQVLYNIEEILELSGYQVLIAEDGETGWQMAKSELPDLIVCDIMMPKLDGYQVLAALREEQATATIPLIFLTAKVERSDRLQGMVKGANDYITKPFKSEELLNAIASRLKMQELYTARAEEERHKAEQLSEEIEQTLEKVETSQQLADIKEILLNQLVSDISDPVSNINLAITMLRGANTGEQRDRYLEILQQECSRQMILLKEISKLQKLLTPENAEILKRFNLLNQPLD